MLATEKSSSAFNFDAQIVENWNGGYKIEIDLEAEYDVKDWKVDFSLPYEIKEAYGVDLIDQDDGIYNISGQNEQVDLQQGQSINPIFIIEDNGQLALIPDFISAEAKISTKTKKTKNKSTTINVESDFDGDLEDAIAAAKDGDIVKLGNKTYHTDGIIINQDITIDGKKNSVIDGDGTSESILYLTKGASGATIQDLEITNGNNGIFAQKASNLTLKNLDINNIGIDETIRNGPNNTGVVLDNVSGVKLLNSKIHNIGRKAVGLENTDGGIVRNLSIENVNLAAEHAQSHDAAGIKLFNTNDITVSDNYFSDINAINIWNDTTNLTTIENNVLEDVGEDFLAPAFNNQVDIFGIYNEKSSNSLVQENEATPVGRFLGLRATEFTTETMTIEDNTFDRFELGTTDYWVNESAEKLIALTENPDQANFSLIAEEYLAQANIGD